MGIGVDAVKGIDVVKVDCYNGGVTALDARAKIARLVEANPRVTVAELVRRTRVSRQRVHQLLELMGYEQDCVWRRLPSTDQERE
jgi:hypothetical protein